MTVIFVGLGGFVGASARYLITQLLQFSLPHFPFGTLLSNVLAGFFIGFIIGIESRTASLPDRSKQFLTSGLLGGLSTFSTFSLDTASMLGKGAYLHAAANVLLNVGFSLLLVVAGYFLARLVKA